MLAEGKTELFKGKFSKLNMGKRKAENPHQKNLLKLCLEIQLYMFSDLRMMSGGPNGQIFIYIYYIFEYIVEKFFVLVFEKENEIFLGFCFNISCISKFN